LSLSIEAMGKVKIYSVRSVKASMTCSKMRLDIANNNHIYQELQTAEVSVNYLKKNINS
jgi:hypothetical protein